MINFKIAGQEEPKKAEVSLAMDCDGDVNLLINGESIAYISSKDGSLGRLSNEGTNLESSGLSFDEYGFIEIDCCLHEKINSEEIKLIIQDIGFSLIPVDPEIFAIVSKKLKTLREKILGENK
jgi:hypothetical protein